MVANVTQIKSGTMINLDACMNIEEKICSKKVIFEMVDMQKVLLMIQ